jgi:hypothetical protein
VSEVETIVSKGITQTNSQTWAARSRGLMSLAGELGQYLGKNFSLAQRGGEEA